MFIFVVAGPEFPWIAAARPESTRLFSPASSESCFFLLLV